MLAGRLHSATQAGGPEADNQRVNLDGIRPEPEPPAPAPEPRGRRATKDPPAAEVVRAPVDVRWWRNDLRRFPSASTAGPLRTPSGQVLVDTAAAQVEERDEQVEREADRWAQERDQ